MRLADWKPLNSLLSKLKPSTAGSTEQCLRLLSFNMQVGIGTRRYRDYVTRGWRNLLPSLQVEENLGRIAEMVTDYDIVALQEIDAGSRRSSYQNQIEWLAQAASFEYWHVQVNRDLGRIAQHGLGLLSRFEPYAVSEHKLPGAIPGRGAIIARFGSPTNPLVVVVTHLALTRRTRSLQLARICALTKPYKDVILMGDTNCGPQNLRDDKALANGQLCVHPQLLPTFPSWRPRRGIDHILVSPGMEVRAAQTLPVKLSDHLPVAMEVVLPATLGRSLQSAALAESASR